VTTAPRDVDELLGLLATGAGEDDGEPVSLLAHGLQCAALLATESPDDVELQVAGLVHDVGTLAEPGRPRTHAATGAALVEPLLGPRVAVLVGRHDDAKRYLVSTDPAYHDRLSEASVATMRVQGGRMTRDEQAELEALPDLDMLLALRRADDAAKVPGREVPDLDTWRAPLLTLLRR
jgi:predicted HD phosphohydrolase